MVSAGAVAAVGVVVVAAVVQLQRFLGLEMIIVCRMWCCFFLVFFSVVFLGFTRFCLIFQLPFYKGPFRVFYFKFLFGRSKVKVFIFSDCRM